MIIDFSEVYKDDFEISGIIDSLEMIGKSYYNFAYVLVDLSINFIPAKYLPELIFYIDSTLISAERIENILEGLDLQISEEEDLGSSEDNE